MPPRCTLAARGGEEGKCGKELLGAPGGRDGCGSPLGTECGSVGGGLLIKRPSTACLPQHLALCTPERIEVWGALAAEASGTRHPARARQPAGTCPIVAPSVLLSWLFRFSLGLSCSLPLFPFTLQRCHLFAWPLWPLSLPHFRMSLRHLFGSLFWEVPKTLEVGRNLGGLGAGSGPQGISWALGQRTTGMTWLPTARGMPITGCVTLPDFLRTLELERTKVDIW